MLICGNGLRDLALLLKSITEKSLSCLENNIFWNFKGWPGSLLHNWQFRQLYWGSLNFYIRTLSFEEHSLRTAPLTAPSRKSRVTRYSKNSCAYQNGVIQRKKFPDREWECETSEENGAYQRDRRARRQSKSKSLFAQFELLETQTGTRQNRKGKYQHPQTNR